MKDKGQLRLTEQVMLFVLLVPLFWAQQGGQHQREVRRTSVIQLVANPERFDGQVVIVQGYVSLEFENYGLYATHDAYDHWDAQSGVWLEFEDGVLKGDAPQKLSGRYVLLSGVFDARSHGHWGAFAGTIRGISEIQRIPSRAESEALKKPKHK